MYSMNLSFFGIGCLKQRQSLMEISKSGIFCSRTRAFNACKFLASLGLVMACCVTASAQSVTLAWNASTSVGVTGYRIYRGGASRSYSSVTNVGNLTQATIAGLIPGVTNYFAVTAYNSGSESAYSTEIVYAAPATNARPVGTLTFAADAGSVTGPFVVSNHIVYQTATTGVTNGGEAIYPFTLAVGGRFVVSAMIKAPDTSANSFYVNVDAEPTDPQMTWDTDISSGFSSQTVSWRGNGTSTSAQFAPKVFNLTAGSHQLIIRGREPNAQLQSITIAPLGATLQLTVTAGKLILLSGLGQPGYTYAVQYTSDMKNWSVLNSAVADANGAFGLVDPTASSTPKRFYRLRQTSP